MPLAISMAAGAGGGSIGSGDGPAMGSKRAKASKVKRAKQSQPKFSHGPRPSMGMERMGAGGTRSEGRD